MSVEGPKSPQAEPGQKKQTQAKELQAVTTAQLTGNNLTVARDRLYRMIDYAVKRQDWYADQSHRLLQIGLALIASGVAICALFVKVEGLSTATLVFSWLLGFCPFLTGLILTYLYARELGVEHPYRKVVDITSWYFAYSFNRPLPTKISKRTAKARNQAAEVARFIEDFFEKWLEQAKASEKEFMREDVEQVAILMLLQRYRAQQVKRMARVLFWGLLVTLVVFMALSLSFSICDFPHKGSTEPVGTPNPKAPSGPPPVASPGGKSAPSSAKPMGSDSSESVPTAHAQPQQKPPPASPPKPPSGEER